MLKHVLLKRVLYIVLKFIELLTVPYSQKHNPKQKALRNLMYAFLLQEAASEISTGAQSTSGAGFITVRETKQAFKQASIQSVRNTSKCKESKEGIKIAYRHNISIILLYFILIKQERICNLPVGAFQRLILLRQLRTQIPMHP